MRFLARTAVVAATLLFSVNIAQAVTVADATGDFLPGFVGDKDADLDVTSFSVSYDAVTSSFLLGAVFAGVIDPTKVGRYVIGVNTGTGVNSPFAAIGQANVRFNQTVTIQKDGTGAVGTTSLAAGSVLVVGNQFIARVPLALLPTTGFTPLQYGWNLWPRNGGAGVAAISDFAPENALLAISPIPEPAAWLMLLVGFGVAGGALRSRSRVVEALA
jgi:PEP-CTERM motif